MQDEPVRVRGGTAPGRLVYRPLVSRVGAVAFGAFALWWLVAVLTGDRPEQALVGVPALAAVAAVVHAVFWRPAVVVDDEAVTLVNALRDVRVPWPALEGIDTRYALTLLVGDHRFASWAAAAPGRPNPVVGGRKQDRDDRRRRAVEPGPARSGTRGTLPPGVAPGAGDAQRSSRDLRADSGAAAFMVEQRWTARCPGGPVPGAAGDVTVRWNVPALTVMAAGVLLGAVAALLT